MLHIVKDFYIDADGKQLIVKRKIEKKNGEGDYMEPLCYYTELQPALRKIKYLLNLKRVGKKHIDLVEDFIEELNQRDKDIEKIASKFNTEDIRNYILERKKETN